MASTSKVPVNIPLKERFWLYRDLILHERKNAAEFDRTYWEMKNAPPVIKTISPTTMVKNNPFTLGIGGTGFDGSAFVVFGGVAHVTINSSDTILACKIEAFDIATAGNYPVSVRNGGNRSISNEITFVVTPS
ncbi:MAG TPA: IPT/TIG domain-containing protein [Chthoniobacterales bacterium]|nr:IPT/TIG domain-containing protein [Chthoniobacterales bacterium]